MTKENNELKFETIWEVQKIKMIETDMKKERFIVNNPDKCADFLYEEIGTLDREVLCLLTLDTKAVVTSFSIIHVGGLAVSLVEPLYVFKTAILKNASSIIIAHNHPSGNPSPSPEDIELTKRIVECGKILKINLADHLVIGNNSYVSLRGQGFI